MRDSQELERYDHAQVEAYIERHASQIPTREVEVFVLYFRDRMSLGRVAGRLGISRSTVAAHLRSLRLRVRARKPSHM